jgi:hypothetical protein
MFSLFGWTPSLRRMLRGRMLACGCSVGVYETYSGEVVQVIDACSPRCSSASHSVDTVVSAEEAIDEEPDPVPMDTYHVPH